MSRLILVLLICRIPHAPIRQAWAKTVPSVTAQVDTQTGEFTKVCIPLPRAAAFIAVGAAEVNQNPVTQERRYEAAKGGNHSTIRCIAMSKVRGG